MHQIVPQASCVAEDGHHLVPGPPGSRSGPLTCPHSGDACAALAPLFASLAPSIDGAAAAWVQSLAPCAGCRVTFEAGRRSLRRLRLGQRERELLIAAAKEAGAPLTVTTPGMSRSESAARRRAALSLGKVGLTASCAKGRNRRATISLTELGHYVMVAYGRYIVAGKPIRWTRPARGATLPGRDPTELRDEALARTEAALRSTLDELKMVLLAAISGRYKNDPEGLEEASRRLERKATLLRSVLEPAGTAKLADPGRVSHKPAA